MIRLASPLPEGVFEPLAASDTHFIDSWLVPKPRRSLVSCVEEIFKVRPFSKLTTPAVVLRDAVVLHALITRSAGPGFLSDDISCGHAGNQWKPSRAHNTVRGRAAHKLLPHLPGPLRNPRIRMPHALMDQADHNGSVDAADDPETIPRSESRLKRLSGATANRLSIPFSLFSFRSRTSDSDGQKLSKQQNGRAKSSRPSESTTRSSTATAAQPDEQDAVGQLPVLPALGTSRGGYLRSLLSLFSDGHDHDGASTQTATPVSDHTPMTDISPWPRSLGLYEYDLNSPVIYKFSKNQQLYIGWPDVVNPPAEALVEFETETLPLLEQDLQGICAHLSQQDIRITYELRMSGHANQTTGTVTLAPTVWILYRSYTLAGNVVTAAALNQVALGLDYLQTDIEIHEGGGRIEASSDRKLVDVDLDDSKDNIQLSNGAILSVHVEDCQQKDTACGALVCVTVQEDKFHTQQSLCRMGGLLKINGKYVLGVTTAHAMLDSSGIFKDSFDDAAGDSDLRTPKGKAVDRDAIVLEVSDVEAWQGATRDAAIDFLGISMNSRGDVALNRSRPQNATDFAMLRLRDLPGTIRNRYVPPGSDEPVNIKSTASASSSALDEGPVYILCGGGRVADAQLVWGSVCFIIRGRNFRVRRVQTSQPLGRSLPSYHIFPVQFC